MTDTRLTIIRGDDVNLGVTLKDGEGEVIDITGYTVYFTAKKKLSDPDSDAIIAKEVTDHEDPENGVTNIALSSTETDIEDDIYYWDIQLKDTDDLISSSAYGQMRVRKDVTIRTSESS